MPSYDPSDFAAFQQLYASVSRLPEDITPSDEFAATIERLSPPKREGGKAVRVLLSIAVSATGETESVRAIEPILPPSARVIAVCTDEAGEVIAGTSPTTTAPEVVAAAEAIGRSLRFRAAERDGVPVAFPDYRMSIEFGGVVEGSIT